MPDGTMQARGAVELVLHGDVGRDFTTESVARALAAAKGAPLLVLLHSYGGDALAGVAIFNALARYSGRKTVMIEGIAASSASLIAMAGDRIVMPANALMMIHEAWLTGASGDADALRDQAAKLDVVSAAYRRTYAARSGRTEDEVAALMKAETWFSAEAAVAAGFADEVAPARDVKALTGGERMLAAYRNRPARIAGVLSKKEHAMDVQTTPAAPAPLPASLEDLEGIAARAKLTADWVLAAAKQRLTAAAARDAALDAVAARDAAPRVETYVRMGASWDSPASVRDRAAEALACRVTGKAPSEPAREFMGVSVAELGRRVMQAAGTRLPINAPPNVVIQAALTTSDFPLLLTGSMQRVLQDRLVAAPGAARTICSQRTTPDFRTGKFLQFAGIAALQQIPEGAEIPHSPPAERGETYQVQTWARGSRWTRQALVNDDLGALEQMTLFANAVLATEAAAFVAMFAANGSGWGPTLTDGQPLFHSSHNNVGSGAVGTAGISAGRIVMRGQRDASGNLVAPEPRFLLVGPAGETAAEQALNQTAIATTESARPVFGNTLTLAVEPRLAGAPWFLFAGRAAAPVLAMVTLAGSDGAPRITQHETGSFDGLEWKLTHDFVIAPMSFVGAVRMTGT